MRLFKKKRAAVLGCGPSGMFAFHALKSRGWDAWIVSKERKSHMYGAQYLHEAIPGLTPADEKPIEIKYRLVAGTVEEYQHKVYGAIPIKTSIETLETSHPAWDIRAAYEAGWDRYAGWIHNQYIDPVWLKENGAEFDLIVSTIPLTQLCYNEEHQFHGTTIWAVGDAPDRGQFAPYKAPPNTVECDGSADRGWYRAASVFGHSTVEWPGNRRPPLPAAAAVTKPTYTTCDCWRKGSAFKFVPLGRYGQWSKGVLSHQVYTQAVQL